MMLSVENQKKLSKMKKEDICVVIDSEKKRLAAIDILERAGESLYHRSQIFWKFDKKLYLHYDIHTDNWVCVNTKISKRKVPLNKLGDLIYVFAEIEEKKTNDTIISTMETNLEPTQKSQPFYMVFVENSASSPTVKHEKYEDAYAETLRLSKKEGQKAYVLFSIIEVEQVQSPKITGFGIPPHI